MNTGTRVAPFVTVGVLGFVLQLAVLDALVRLAGVAYPVATAVAVEIAVLHNFLWHERWTWRDRQDGRFAATCLRLARFNGATGLVSIAGNVALTAVVVETLGVPVVAGNAIAVALTSLVNFLVADRWVFRRVGRVMAAAGAAWLLSAAATVSAAELKPETLAAFEQYVARTEARRAREAHDPSRFLASDFESPDKGAELRAQVRRGDIPVAAVDTTGAGDRRIDVPDGLIHHWRGTVFVPGVTVDGVLDTVRTPPRRNWQEDVLETRIVNRSPKVDAVFLKIRREQIVTVTYNTEHLVTYDRDAPGRASSRSVSLRIAELDQPGTPAEREKPAGDDRGFLWRMNSYWRYEAAPGGVFIELESITLSRSLPWGLGTVASPVIDRVARESVARTLAALHARLVAHQERASSSAGISDRHRQSLRGDF